MIDDAGAAGERSHAGAGGGPPPPSPPPPLLGGLEPVKEGLRRFPRTAGFRLRPRSGSCNIKISRRGDLIGLPHVHGRRLACLRQKCLARLAKNLVSGGNCHQAKKMQVRVVRSGAPQNSILLLFKGCRQ
jgi:hypothetical protein